MGNVSKGSCAAVTTFLVIVGYFYFARLYFISTVFNEKNNYPLKQFASASCKNIFAGIQKGKWVPRPMTSTERKKIDTFLETYRTGWGLPKTLQREDGLCGNASFAKDPKASYRFFRALCDPNGSTPCCRNRKCVSAPTPNQCQCEDCLDLRQRKHAEYSDWVPDDKKCKVHKYTGKEPCQVLDGMTVFISGDSLMRHLYIAFQLLLNNDLETGSLKKDVPKAKAERCTGMSAYNERLCRNYISTDTSRVCDGRVNVTFREYYNTGMSREFLHEVQELKSKSLVVAGIGHHDAFNSQAVKDKYIGPALKYMAKAKWPRLIWSMPNAQGLLRETKTKTLPKMVKFLEEMTKYLKEQHVPILDSYSLTNGMVSTDGIHHGIGVNLQKVQFILNHIDDLKRHW